MHEKKLKRFFELFAEKGERNLDTSDDIRKIIEDRKLLSSSILTSRLNSREKIARYFPIVVRVDRFSKDHAKTFRTKHAQNSGQTKELKSICQYTRID